MNAWTGTKLVVECERCEERATLETQDHLEAAVWADVHEDYHNLATPELSDSEIAPATPTQRRMKNEHHYKRHGPLGDDAGLRERVAR